MSKIMATSGNQAPVLKGSTTVEDVTADAGAAGLFAALFGGMQLVETEGDVGPVQPNPETDANLTSEQIFDPHVAAMLGATKSISGQVEAETIHRCY